jgi:hypothetical protein
MCAISRLSKKRPTSVSRSLEGLTLSCEVCSCELWWVLCANWETEPAPRAISLLGSQMSHRMHSRAF